MVQAWWLKHFRPCMGWAASSVDWASTAEGPPALALHVCALALQPVDITGHADCITNMCTVLTTLHELLYRSRPHISMPLLQTTHRKVHKRLTAQAARLTRSTSQDCPTTFCNPPLHLSTRIAARHLKPISLQVLPALHTAATGDPR